MSDGPAIQPFLKNVARIRKQLAALEELTENHFDVLPDDVNYGHVGSTDFVTQQLGSALAHWGADRSGEKK